MTEETSYRYEISDFSPLGISGWIFNTDNPQPCELLFSSNGKTLFRAIASGPQFIDEADEPVLAGFRLKFDRSIWNGIDNLTIHTADGFVLATIERHATGTKDVSRMRHKFAYKSMVEVSGRFLPDHNDEERVEHSVKLYSQGRLLAYQSAATESKQEDANPDWYSYSFSMLPGKRILDERIYLTIDDSLIVSCNTRDVLTLPKNTENYFVPMPIDLAEVISFSTKGGLVEAFDLNLYLGIGKGLILVFGREDDFHVEMELKDLPAVSISFKDGQLIITQ